MSTLRAQVRWDKLRVQLRQYPQFLREQEEQLVRLSLTRLISSGGQTKGLVQITPPGAPGVGAAAAKKAGEGAVVRDVKRVYVHASTVFAELEKVDPAKAAAYWSAVKKGQLEQAKRVLYGAAIPAHLKVTPQPWDGGAAHKAKRKKSGRVYPQKPSVVLDQVTPLNQYIKEKKKNVGWMASSLVVAGSMLGVIKSVPKFISRHRGKWASIVPVGDNGLRMRITLTADGHPGVQKMWIDAAVLRGNAMMREAPRVLSIAARKAGLIPSGK